MSNFMDIVMEAKRKKKRPARETKPVEEEDDELPEDETPTDYTDEDEPADDEEETDSEEETPDDDELPEDEEPTDYTDEEGENVESVEEEPVEGDEPPEDEEPTDYTDEEPGEGDGEEGTGDDPDGDEETDVEEETPDEGEEAPTEEETVSESKNNRLLLEDYTNLYFRTKDFVSKLSSIDKSNMILNQIIVQMDKNLNRLKQALWDYISFEFNKVNYTTNIFKYNLFVEAFQINLEMLHTAKDAMLKEDQKDEKKPQSRKKSQ